VGLYEAGPAQTFRLQMAMGVGAAKMSGALADALKPRCSDAKDIAAFEVQIKEAFERGRACCEPDGLGSNVGYF